MNHPLAVYTVIYVAILFVTVSIWGGKIGVATGDYRVLLLAQAIFGLKLAIDDYVHFQGAKNRLYLDLCLSLLIYLLLAASIATAAIERGSTSAVSFAFMFIAGALWLCISGFAGPDRARRIGWLIVDILSAVLLLVVAVVKPPQSTAYTGSSGWLVGLVVLLVFDFFYFGTLRRLAELHGHGDHAPAGQNGCTVSTPAAAPESVPAVAAPAVARAAEALGERREQIADRNDHEARSRELADSIRGFLIAVHTGGIATVFAVASSLVNNKIHPVWAVAPIGLFVVGLVFAAVSMFLAQAREIKRRDAAAKNAPAPEFKCRLWWSWTWNWLSLVVFLLATVVGLCALATLTIPA